LAGRVKKDLTGRELRPSLLKLMGGTQAASDPEVDRRLKQDPRFIESYSSFPLPGAVDCFDVDTFCRLFLRDLCGLCGE